MTDPCHEQLFRAQIVPDLMISRQILNEIVSIRFKLYG